MDVAAVLNRPDIRAAVAIVTASDGMLLMLTRSSSSKIVWCSPETEAILGYESSRLEGQGVLDIVHPDQLEDAQEEYFVVKGGGSIVAEYQVLHAEGNYTLMRLVSWLSGGDTVATVMMPSVETEVQFAESQRQ